MSRLFANAQSARSWYRRLRESLNLGYTHIPILASITLGMLVRP